MASQVTLQANGLNFSPNNLSLPQGSLLVADNVIIRRDNVVESRRGFNTYSEALGSSIDRMKQLIEYKGRLLVHFSDTLAFDTLTDNVDGRKIFDDFAGSYSETSPGLRIKSIEANKNLYFTTSEGIKRISARTAADFTTDSGFIQPAGAVQALDFTALLDISQGETSGFLPSDSAVAYRVVWGYKDLNDTLVLGVPSDRIVVYNFISDQMAMDINGLCVVLDTINQSPCMINDGDYASSFYTPANSTGSTLLNNVLNLAEKLDLNILFADSASAPLSMGGAATYQIANNTVTITFDSGTPNNFLASQDKVILTGFTEPTVNTVQTIDSADATTITFTIATTADTGPSPIPAPAEIYSYNYRDIINTGDELYPDPLSDLVLSVPPTSEQLRNINDTLTRIVERLKVELDGVIPTALQTAYVTPFSMTERANVELTITIPSNINDSYFVQIYRTRNFTADGTQSLGDTGGIPIVPDDEMRLVAELFPTSSDISAEEIQFLDNYPEELIINNTNLYTNPNTGDGTLQANYQPPFAKDINTFKNYTFFSNTKTKYQIPIFQLLGVSNITTNDKITISNGTDTNTYTFVTGVQQITTILFNMADLTASDYITIYSANDEKIYDFYYVVDAMGTAPVNAGHIAVPVNVLSTFNDNELAQRSMDTINEFVYDFDVVEDTLPTIQITNVNEGITTDATSTVNAGTPFTIVTTVDGNGEDASQQQVLLSSLPSAAQAIDETARSFIRVINKQADSPVNAYYISGGNTPPGQINIVNKELSDAAFYIIGSNSGIGSSFNPDISPINTDIDVNTAADPTVVETTSPHGLQNGETIIITNSNSSPDINGKWPVTVIDTTHFSVPVDVSLGTPGSQGVWSRTSDIEYATNEVRPNRLYYSKVNQPDAVPLLNYLDVGAQDKAILRIFPLRDSLFIFKEDGLFRVSGEIAPFVLALFDASCVLTAPDSVDVCNNEIYAWTLKGISKVNETGAANNVSRPIDTEILRLGSSAYPNFTTVTWGVGYDSDDTYTVYTNKNIDDEVATLGFTYNNITNTWTNVDRSQTCGIVLDTNDKLYMGNGDENHIDQERKNFDRTDYSDDDFEVELAGSSIFSNNTMLKLTSVSDIAVGDVFVQEQDLTIYLFNKILLELDNDPTVQDDDYFASLKAVPGVDLRERIESLSVKLDTDPGLLGGYFDRIDTKMGTILSNAVGLPTVVTTGTPPSTPVAHELVNGRIITITGTQTPESIPVLSGDYEITDAGIFGTSTTFEIGIDVNTAGGTGLSWSTAPNESSFQDIKACFNAIVARLNSDPGATYSTYKEVTNTTSFEAVVTNVNTLTRKVTLNVIQQWVVGPITVYKAIDKKLVYAPETMGDAISYKQVREATVMLESRAVTNFSVFFSTDLIPEFFEVEFTGSGNGIFGSYANPGFGYGFFGGMGNAAPFRTIVPLKSQRCRYLIIQVEHDVAREKFVLNGVTLTGEVGKSTRAYR